MSSATAKCFSSGGGSSTKSRGVLCKVCGDEASGFHYGVDSCEGCKGFFRRCLTQGMNHKCAVDERCEITPFSRNSCQFCRLKKCFQVGMSREASRLGRRPKRLKEMNQNSEATTRYDKKAALPPLGNLFPFPLPFPQIAFNMPDLQIFMRNFGTPMGVITSHQASLLSPTPPLPPTPHHHHHHHPLSSFYHFESGSPSFFPASNPTQSPANAFPLFQDAESAGKSALIERMESSGSHITLVQNASPLTVSEILKSSSFAGAAAAGPGFSIPIPPSALQCYLNSSSAGASNGAVFPGDFGFIPPALSAMSRAEKFALSPHIFSPVIVAGNGVNAKRFKPNLSNILPKSRLQQKPLAFEKKKETEPHVASAGFSSSNSPHKMSSSFSVDFLKSSSSNEDSKNSPSEVSGFFINSPVSVSLSTSSESLKHADFSTASKFQSSAIFGNVDPHCHQSLPLSSPARFAIGHHLGLDWRFRGTFNAPFRGMGISPASGFGEINNCQHGGDDLELAESKYECGGRHKCGLKNAIGFINKAGRVILKRSAFNHNLSAEALDLGQTVDMSQLEDDENGNTDPSASLVVVDDEQVNGKVSEVFTSLESTNDSPLSFDLDRNLDSHGADFSTPSDDISSSGFGKLDSKKTLLFLSLNKNNETKVSLLHEDENDSAVNVDDKDQNNEAFCRKYDLEFLNGSRDNRLISASDFQSVLKTEKFKIDEEEWAALSEEMKKQVFVAAKNGNTTRNCELINLVESDLVKAHLHTCLYTSGKVREGIRRYEELLRCRAENLIEPEPDDPVKWWEEFVNNMVPVIKRIVSFSKKLPGFSGLNQEDQIVLIKHGSFEVILTRYTLLFSDAGMFLPDMTLLIPRNKISLMPLGDFFEEQWKFANDFNNLGLDDAEIGMLTGVMIMNPEREGLENVKDIQRLQGLYLQALYTSMKRNRPETYNEYFLKTVCSLPKLSHINELHSKKMQSMKMLGCTGIKMPDLHKEVFHY